MSLSRLGLLIKAFKAFRGMLVTMLSLIIIIPVALYILLSSQWAHNKIRDIAQSELTELFGAQVNIGSVSFTPFNRLLVGDICVHDDNDSIALTVESIDTRVEFWDLMIRNRFIIDFATVSGLDLKLYRDSINAPLNIDGIIKRLQKPQDPDKETIFKLRLNDVSLINCSASYDIKSCPYTSDKFDPHHISIIDLSLNAFVPQLANDNYNVRLRDLSFVEQSGFKLDDVTLNLNLTPQQLSVADLTIALENSTLSFAPIKVPLNGIKSLSHIAETDSLSLQMLSGSHIYLPDLMPFVPLLGDLDYDLDIDFDLSCLRSAIGIHSLNISDRNDMVKFEAKGNINSINNVDALEFEDIQFECATDPVAINQTIHAIKATMSPFANRVLSNIGHCQLRGYVDGPITSGVIDTEVNSQLAHISFNGNIDRDINAKSVSINGILDVDSLILGRLIDNQHLNRVSASVDMESTFGRHGFAANADAVIRHFDYKGYSYRDITAKADVSPSVISADLSVDDPNVQALVSGHWQKTDGNHEADVFIDVNRLRLDSLHLTNHYPGFNLTGKASLNGYGPSLELCSADIKIEDVGFYDNEGYGIGMKQLLLSSNNINEDGQITIDSDYLEGSVDGHYRYTTIVPEVYNIIKTILPALATDHNGLQEEDEIKAAVDAYNNFDFNISIHDCEEICKFFKLPVVLIDRANLYGTLNSAEQRLSLKLDMPWIGQGNNIIEGTALAINLEGRDKEGGVYLTSMMPTKKGDMDISANIFASDAHVDTKIFWTIRREIPINGLIDFSTFFNRDVDNQLTTQIKFNPGKINFGEDIWSIGESLITYSNNRALINDFELTTPSQSVTINGVAGPEATDQLKIDLNNIQLIDIFETLEIDKALISGYATGTVEAASVLGKEPILNCESLKVRSIGYNYCTLGDADVRLSVGDGGKKFNFDAEVTQPEGYHSYIDGYIEPATEGLNLNITADHIKVGFMKPFMEAFTSDVDGYASGNARLYGTFKYIDLVGDIFVDDLSIKIDFTNTYYHASDSIHIVPGQINLKDVTITDDYGHTALLNGWVAHKFFHDASFDFAVTNAHNFLSYDVTEKLSPQWYGRIFGNGSAMIKGRPGVVDIGVNMTTADNSNFTFVLSDAEEASEYQFITFRDKTPRIDADSLDHSKEVPKMVYEAKRKHDDSSEDIPTAYNMDINIDATPQALLTIVMDPVGGDRIRSYGSGHMRMTYGSVDNDLRLYGKYTLERGSYNFTLQDIIIKDFTIKDGSSITFLGDPYNAQLDIDAYYQVNANLSDLDESFLYDKELNRTNVQVRALLNVRGDMLQPDISFDLEFPTLTQDIYRKVKSIVSTEDMMNRQIIYLLALNRFYTPDYMASTTKGNELFSVASSTISSQLSSMLGKLSENWSIAPNLRSDRGDFSDLEVDLTLSSSLLNNRLLFNGNFGYRDKSLNTNQFVGDFDIEYLLDKKGEWRLKAYNRYNDQNYYLRTAQTTQGVGIVYRRDFDNTFRFLNKLRHKSKTPEPPVSTDTIIETIEIPIPAEIDSIVIEQEDITKDR